MLLLWLQAREDLQLRRQHRDSIKQQHPPQRTRCIRHDVFFFNSASDLSTVAGPWWALRQLMAAAAYLDSLRVLGIWSATRE